MNIKWILVAVVVTCVLSRYGRRKREGATSSWWGPLVMFACFAVAFMFLFMGNRGPVRHWDSWIPNLPSIQFSEMPSPPSPAVEVHVPRLIQARQRYEEANHSHGISKSAYTSSGKTFSEKTIVINEDGTEIAIVQTSKSRAPQTYRGRFIGIAGFAVAGLIVVAFLYIGYLFLDAGTRGQFSWTLRIASIVAFGVICAVVALLRQRM